jgi:YD repeat-containing protein
MGSFPIAAAGPDRVYTTCSFQGGTGVCLVDPTGAYVVVTQRVAVLGHDRQGRLWTTNALNVLDEVSGARLLPIEVRVWELPEGRSLIPDRPRWVSTHLMSDLYPRFGPAGEKGVWVADDLGSYTSFQISRTWLNGIWYTDGEEEVLVLPINEVAEALPSGTAYYILGVTSPDASTLRLVLYNTYTVLTYRLEWGWRPTQAADWYVIETPDGYERRAVDGSWQEIYDAQGRLRYRRDEVGMTVEYVYDPTTGRLAEIRWPDGRTTRIEDRPDRFVVTDRQGRIIQALLEDGQVTTFQMADGSRWTFTYAGAALIRKVAPGGVVTEYAYNPTDIVVRQRVPTADGTVSRVRTVRSEWALLLQPGECRPLWWSEAIVHAWSLPAEAPGPETRYVFDDPIGRIREMTPDGGFRTTLRRPDGAETLVRERDAEGRERRTWTGQDAYGRLRIRQTFAMFVPGADGYMSDPEQVQFFRRPGPAPGDPSRKRLWPHRSDRL